MLGSDFAYGEVRSLHVAVSGGLAALGGGRSGLGPAISLHELNRVGVRLGGIEVLHGNLDRGSVVRANGHDKVTLDGTGSGQPRSRGIVTDSIHADGRSHRSQTR